MKRLAIVLLGLVVHAPASAGSPAAVAVPAATIADVQVIALEHQQFVLRLRATGPQAFDVIRRPGKQGGGTLSLRIYRTVLGDVADLGPQPFGSLKFATESKARVVVTITLAKGWHATASQGGTTSVVEVRIYR